MTLLLLQSFYLSFRLWSSVLTERTTRVPIPIWFPPLQALDLFYLDNPLPFMASSSQSTYFNCNDSRLVTFLKYSLSLASFLAFPFMVFLFDKPLLHYFTPNKCGLWLVLQFNRSCWHCNGLHFLQAYLFSFTCNNLFNFIRLLGSIVKAYELQTVFTVCRF